MTPHAAFDRSNRRSAEFRKFLLRAFLVLGGTIFIAVSARLSVPMWPVPMTMQSFAILIVGLAYGSRLGAVTLLVYLMEGLVGLPVFAGGSGLAYAVGPTGGYLIGFVIAAFIVGLATEGDASRSLVRAVGAALLGAIIIHVFGFVWLATLIGFEKAWIGGVVPFALGDVFKAALAALTISMPRRLIKKS
tara:strand:+ start:4073 stop:4642 length:570 start_codon:yes stop_codon:yes gene_type:complete